MSENDYKFVIANGAGDMVLAKHGIMVSLDEMMIYASYVPMFFETAEAALAHAGKHSLNQFVRAKTMADFVADSERRTVAMERSRYER